MDKIIENITREVVQQTMLQHLPYYGVMLALLFLATAAAGYFGAYSRPEGNVQLPMLT